MFKNLYISSPEYWEQYLNQPPKQRNSKQRGGGLLYRQAHMRPVTDDFIKHVSPVTAEVDRARSQLEEKMEEGEPHMPLKRKLKSDLQGPPGRRVVRM